MGCNRWAARADIAERVPNYLPIIGVMKCRHDIRVRRWRRTMSGCAWRVYYSDGRVINWIESPFPKTPISLAIFLHEVGHHAIGFETFRKRCEEEYHVWIWALQRMRELGVMPDKRVENRFERSMRYAVGKAMRRGAKALPEPLHQYLPDLSQAA
jgi:hypothetical protein